MAQADPRAVAHFFKVGLGDDRTLPGQNENGPLSQVLEVRDEQQEEKGISNGKSNRIRNL